MKRDTEHLLDILSSACLAKSHIQGATRHKFMRNTKLQDSVIRRLEIIGEADGRPPAGYVMASPDSKTFDDPGVFVEIARIKAWRETSYPGVGMWR